MIPSKTVLPTITPPGTYGQLVELITAVPGFSEQAAERLADKLLFRLGLYGPIPGRQDEMCSAVFFNAAPQHCRWVQCDETPGHVRRGEPLHKHRRSGSSWFDDAPQSMAARDDD